MKRRALFCFGCRFFMLKPSEPLPSPSTKYVQIEVLPSVWVLYNITSSLHAKGILQCGGIWIWGTIFSSKKKDFKKLFLNCM